jgi:carboxypeptidase family protein
VISDRSGSYFFLRMPIGQYSITVELSGFNSAAIELTLETAQKGRQDFELQVGQTT